MKSKRWLLYTRDGNRYDGPDFLPWFDGLSDTEKDKFAKSIKFSIYSIGDESKEDLIKRAEQLSINTFNIT